MTTTGLFINGASRSTESMLTITDPARPTEVVGQAAAAAESDVADAIAAARSAFPGWSNLSARERADLMAQAIDGLEVERDAIAKVLTQENGKIIHESWVDALVFELRWNLALTYADQVETVTVLEPQPGLPVRTEVSYQPLGVATIIVPFNWPLAILAASLPQALLAGNTVVVKPPVSAPLATTMLTEYVASRLPAGVLNVVTGPDSNMSALISDVDKVCFTGGVKAGSTIMERAAQSLTRITLELGGNDPAIFLDDGVLDDDSFDRLFGSILESTGQVCMNAKRIYVHRSRMNEIVAGLTTRFESIVLGHGLDEKTTHGPLHSRAQYEFVNELIAEAKDAGADVREFGSLPTDPTLENGNFIRPTLVIDPNPNLRVVVEEAFGPVVPILAFDDEDDIVAIANDSWGGLCASVWSADEDKAKNMASKIVAGYIWINDHGAARLDLRAPFGGMKSSGLGREQGIEGLRAFMDTRSIAVSQ